MQDENPGNFDKVREIKQHILHKQADGSYIVDVSHTKTVFGDQTHHSKDAVEFLLVSEQSNMCDNSVKEIAIVFIVKATDHDILEKHLRKNANPSDYGL